MNAIILTAEPCTSDPEARLRELPGIRTAQIHRSPFAVVAVLELAGSAVEAELEPSIARLLRALSETSRVLREPMPVVGILLSDDPVARVGLATLPAKQAWHRGDFAVLLANDAQPDTATVLRVALNDDLHPPSPGFSPLAELSSADFAARIAALLEAQAGVGEDPIVFRAALRAAVGGDARATLAAWTATVLRNADRAAAQARGNDARPLLLWVDDHPENNLRLLSEAEALGLRVRSATSTAEALPLLEDPALAAVITDLGRGEDQGWTPEAGLELARAARQRHPELPIGVWSTRSDAQLRAACTAAGVTRKFRSTAEVLGFLGTLSSGQPPVRPPTRKKPSLKKRGPGGPPRGQMSA